jgi:hypothetical protein
LRPLHVVDDFFGHPNETVLSPFILPNLVRKHLAISLLFDHIGGAIAFVSPVGLGVDERTLDGEFFFCSSHPKVSSLVKGTCWTCGLLDGT